MYFSRSRCITFPVVLALLFCSRSVLTAQTPSLPAPPTVPQSTTPASPATQVPAAAPPSSVSPSSLPAIPAGTPGSAADLPSLPPASDATGQMPSSPTQTDLLAPLQSPTPAQPGVNPPPYRDPLEEPIVVAPPASTTPLPPAAVPGESIPSVPPPSTPSPTYGTPPSPVAVTMPAPATAASLPSMPAFDFPEEVPPHTDALGSTYIPVDSPIYPMALRLYSLGYLDDIFIGMRPWTRRSLLHALDKTAPDVTTDGNNEAIALLARLQTLLAAEVAPKDGERGRVYGLETVYTRLMGIHGNTLRDSYHLGQTLVNDYGRPYQPGFNNITGFSTLNEWGRFSLYVRGEYQHAPAATGYNVNLAGYLSSVDQIPYPGDNNYQLHQDTIPSGPIAAENPFRLQEAIVSYHLLGHEASVGKQDAWLGPGYGGAMAWSNNAESIYSFRINRVEPMHIPYFDKIFGTLRYDLFVGSLKGHSYPNAPWVHQEDFQLSPTRDFQIGFQRTAIWGGHGHGCFAADGSVYPCNEPITLHTFLKSVFDISDTTPGEKYSRDDPGARFSSFTFSWRLPFLRRSLTLYTDSTAHDDVSPISAPRRAGWRPGIFLSHVPGVPKLDIRVEGDYTDYVTLRSANGQGNYYETIQRQGYTNKGFIFGDWMGREAKGGQAWLTYHLSAQDFVQFEYLNKKNAKDFIVYGTTQNQFKLEAMKHFGRDIEADAWIQYEHWTAPIYLTHQQDDYTGALQITWYPKLRTDRTAAFK